MADGAQGGRARVFRSHDDRRLFYREYGDTLSANTTVVCLPGLTRNAKDFERFASRRAGARRVLCPDYRGRGRSAYDPDWHNYEAQVTLRDVSALLAAANVHRAVICGTSFGGLLAMALGAVAPTVLAGVILNDVGPAVEGAGSARILEYIRVDRPQPDWETARAALKDADPALAFRTEEDWDRFTRGSYRRGEDGLLHFDFDVALARPFLHQKGPPDLWPLFRSLREIPVLAIRGALSDVLSERTLGRMADLHPGLSHVTIDGVGHAPSLSEPEAERAIDDFLSRIDG